MLSTTSLSISSTSRFSIPGSKESRLRWRESLWATRWPSQRFELFTPNLRCSATPMNTSRACQPLASPIWQQIHASSPLERALTLQTNSCSCQPRSARPNLMWP